LSSTRFKARTISYAVFEAVLLTHVSDEEDDSADLGYIETAEIVQTIAPTQTDVTKAYLVGPQDASPTPEEEYMASGTYTPTLTFSDGSGSLVGAFGYSRVGNGYGTPLAGDTVVAWGVFSFADIVNGETIDITYPFESAADPYPAVEIMGTLDTNVNASIQVFDETTARVTLAATDNFAGSIAVRFTYQTANAVDP